MSAARPSSLVLSLLLAVGVVGMPAAPAFAADPEPPGDCPGGHAHRRGRRRPDRLRLDRRPRHGAQALRGGGPGRLPGRHPARPRPHPRARLGHREPPVHRQRPGHLGGHERLARVHRRASRGLRLLRLLDRPVDARRPDTHRGDAGGRRPRGRPLRRGPLPSPAPCPPAGQPGQRLTIRLRSAGAAHGPAIGAEARPEGCLPQARGWPCAPASTSPRVSTAWASRPCP